VAVNRRTWIVSLAIGTIYGLALRFLGQISLPAPNAVWEMTLAFMFIGPFAIGFIAIALYSKPEGRLKISWPAAIFWPWPAIVLACLATVIFDLEGWICVVLFLPAGLVMSSLGGITALLIKRRSASRIRTTTIAIAVLPIVLAFPEARIPESNQLRTVDTQIVIHAPQETVWRNIKSVPAIAPEELQWSWARAIGFPRPIEATLSKESVGGVRQASFAGGVVFTETIFDWQPPSEIAFTIRPNTDSIPATTMDEHVKVGGRYFDVLTGRYQVTPQTDGSMLLRLTSQERLSTHFNAYAGFWTDAVMWDIQKSILKVIKDRCEQNEKASLVR
jgi:hypothetical protein